MAKDPKAMDQMVHYQDGYIRACRGLIEATIGTGGINTGVAVKTGPSGRKYLINTTKAKAGKGGKEALLEMLDGSKYTVRYGGTYRALVVAMAAYMHSGSVKSIKSIAGKRAGRRI